MIPVAAKHKLTAYLIVCFVFVLALIQHSARIPKTNFSQMILTELTIHDYKTQSSDFA